jgi:hypothetical protein
MFLSRAALYAITFRKAAEGGMVQRVSTVAFEGIRWDNFRWLPESAWNYQTSVIG